MTSEKTTVPVSVIIPCYCCSETLNRALDSVLEQTVLPTEIILVEDASPDEGRVQQMIERYSQEQPARDSLEIKPVFLEQNLGPGAARNVGWDIVTNDYIAFLDADDSWNSRKLEIQYHWMKANPEYVLSCHGTVYYGKSDAAKVPQREKIKTSDISKTKLLLKNYIPTRSVMLKNQPDYRFHPYMRYAEDYWLWLNMCVRGEKMAKLHETLAYSYKSEFGEGGLSKNLNAMHAGVLCCYKDLCNDGFIGRTELLGLFALEKVKYLRRIVYSSIF